MRRLRARRLAGAALLLPVVLGLLVVAADPTGSTQAGVEACTPAQEGPDGGVPRGPERVGLKSRLQGETRLQFIRYRRPKRLDLRVRIASGEAPAPGTPVRIVPTTFRRDDGVEIPESQIAVLAAVSRGREDIDIRFCVDPARPEPVSPGVYTGQLLVDDSAFHADDEADYNLSVILQDNRMYIPLGLAVVTGLATVLLLSSRKPGSGSTGRGLGVARRRHWLSTQDPWDLLCVVVCGLGGALSSFVVNYLGDPGWVLDWTPLRELVTATVAAAFAIYEVWTRVFRSPRPAAEGGGG